MCEGVKSEGGNLLMKKRKFKPPGLTVYDASGFMCYENAAPLLIDYQSV